MMIWPISTRAAYLLPMYWAKSPRGKRMRAPEIIGIEIMKPCWAGDRPNSSEMNGAMAPFITQMAKQKSKYRKDTKSVGGCPDFKKVLKPPIGNLLISPLPGFRAYKGHLSQIRQIKCHRPA